MSEPIAYFLTWTTYGTWLSGDDRGWVDHKDAGAHVPYKPANVALSAAMTKAMGQEAVRFSERQRTTVEESIRESCRLNNWTVHALGVRSNHVHVVLSSGNAAPEKVMTHLKAYASRALNDIFGPRRWWTRHGSTRYVKTASSLFKAVEYVEHQ